MKKMPYERFVQFLLLARNKYSAISKYLSAYKLGDLNGNNFRSVENSLKKLASLGEEKFLNDTKPNDAVLGDEIDINTFVPNELKNLQEKLNLVGNPFEDLMVKFILENLILRRSVEVYLTTSMESEDIVSLINERFRINLTTDALEAYEYWLYDIAEMSPDQLDGYFNTLPKEERDYKYMAYMDKEDYVKWKMRAGGTLNRKDAIRQIMEDAFFNFKESIESENISHLACKTWSDIFFKAADYLENSEDKGGVDIFKKFKFNLIKDSENKVVPFEDLLRKGENEQK